MPQVSIYTVDGERIDIAKMDVDSAMGLVEAFADLDNVNLTVALDENAVSHIARDHIVRIDIDA